MYRYKYESPEDKGYTFVEMSRRRFNVLFPQQRLSVFQKAEVWIKGSEVMIQRFTNLLGITIETLAFPINGFIQGFGNPDLYRGYKRLYQEKKYGAFSSSRYHSEDSPTLYNLVAGEF